MSASIRLGTRGSALALAQAEIIADELGGAEIVEVRGAASAASAGDKGRFVRGVEEALRRGEVDVGVHSAKDLPSDLPGELRLSGVPAREDASDAYVGEATSFELVPAGARIGTSSLRRRSQLLALRPDLDVADLRGNVDTRLRRLSRGDFDGVVLASAGMRRLGREGEIAFRFTEDVMTPAPGQGALALETRRQDEVAAAVAASISDAAALVELTAERAVVGELDATCRTPVGVHAELADGVLRLDAFVGLPDGSEWARDTLESDAEDPVSSGRALAERLRSVGAGELLRRAERRE